MTRVWKGWAATAALAAVTGTLHLGAQETVKRTAPEVGKPAPVVRLNDHEGVATNVGGEQEDGLWTVLAFYPKAATPG